MLGNAHLRDPLQGRLFPTREGRPFSSPGKILREIFPQGLTLESQACMVTYMNTARLAPALLAPAALAAAFAARAAGSAEAIILLAAHSEAIQEAQAARRLANITGDEAHTARRRARR